MRPFTALGALCLLTAGVAGCGADATSDRTDTGADPAAARTRHVADSWRGSEAEARWREGFFPLDEAVQPPKGGFRGTDQLAFEARNFTVRGALSPKGDQGWVYRDGSTLRVTVMSPKDAYGSLNAYGEPKGAPLEVTAIQRGEMTVLTNQGMARVPAWLYTIKGYDTPLKQLAARPSKPPRNPVKRLDSDRDRIGVEPVSGLTTASANGRTLTVKVQHSCEASPAVDVLETRDSVVLTGWGIGAKKGALCHSIILDQPVTVTLDRPVGNRVLLDAYSGAPLSYNGWDNSE
jgi:hypothetical protein